MANQPLNEMPRFAVGETIKLRDAGFVIASISDDEIVLVYPKDNALETHEAIWERYPHLKPTPLRTFGGSGISLGASEANPTDSEYVAHQKA